MLDCGVDRFIAFVAKLYVSLTKSRKKDFVGRQSRPTHGYAWSPQLLRVEFLKLLIVWFRFGWRHQLRHNILNTYCKFEAGHRQ